MQEEHASSMTHIIFSLSGSGRLNAAAAYSGEELLRHVRLSCPVPLGEASCISTRLVLCVHNSVPEALTLRGLNSIGSRSFSTNWSFFQSLTKVSQ